MSVTIRAHFLYREGDYSKPDGVLETEATTVRDALEKFIEQNAKWQRHLFNEEGELRRFLNVYVDEEDIRFLQWLETPLRDGSKVEVVPAVSGG